MFIQRHFVSNLKKTDATLLPDHASASCDVNGCFLF